MYPKTTEIEMENIATKQAASTNTIVIVITAVFMTLFLAAAIFTWYKMREDIRKES
jgi:cytochrome bd-type quinol oxidase subunit 2